MGSHTCEVTRGWGTSITSGRHAPSPMQRHNKGSLLRSNSGPWIQNWFQIPKRRQRQDALPNQHSHKLQLSEDLHGISDEANSWSCDHTVIWLATLACLYKTQPALHYPHYIIRTDLQVQFAVSCTNEYKWQCINIYIYKWQCVYILHEDTFVNTSLRSELLPSDHPACTNCAWWVQMIVSEEQSVHMRHATTNLFLCTPPTSVHVGANVCLHSSYSSSNCIVKSVQWH